MGGFRIGRKHAAHTYPESRAIGGAANGGVIVFGTDGLAFPVAFIPPGFNSQSATPTFDIEMPFRGNLTGMVVRQNTHGSGIGNVLYEVLIGGAPAPGLFVNMGLDEMDRGATPAIPPPFLYNAAPPGADNTQRISVRATVTGGVRPAVLPEDITVTLAFSAT